MLARALTTFLASPLRALNIGNALTAEQFLNQDLLSLGGSFLSRAASGVVVNHATSLRLGAVWQAVSMISGDVAMMPFNVFRRLENNFREIDLRHPADFLISVQPNAEMPAFELWRRHLIHALLWQNGYLHVVREFRAPSGRPLGLFNLLPDRTAPKRDRETGDLFYVTEVEVNGVREKVRLEPHEVIHTKGLTIQNEEGWDLVWAARDAWGLALAAQGFASKFFAHGAGSGGILEIPNTFSERAAKNLEEGFRARTGEDEWFRVAILRDGAKFHATTISPRDAELTALSEVQVRQIARYFNLPPFKLGLEDSQSYNSAEMAQLVYLMSALNHWMAAVKSAASIKLLTETQRRRRSHFLAFNPSVLVETDTKTMNEVLAMQRQNTIINANEYRSKINLPPRDDPEAFVYENPNTTSGAPLAESDEVPEDVLDVMRGLLRQSLARIGTRISRKLQRNPDQWRESEAENRRQFREEMRYVAGVCGGESLSIEWEREFFAQVNQLIDADDAQREAALTLQLPDAIAERLGATPTEKTNGQPAAA